MKEGYRSERKVIEVKHLIFFLSMVVVVNCPGISFCQGSGECMGFFSGTIHLQGDVPFGGTMSVLCRNLGVERLFRYNGSTGEWILELESDRWIEGIVTADPGYELAMDIPDDDFPESPEAGEYFHHLEFGLKSLAREVAREYVKSYESLHAILAPAGGAALGVDEETLKQLRALGYID